MKTLVRRHILGVGVALVAATLGVIIASPGASQGELDRAGELLEEMNKHVVKGEYEQVIVVGKRIDGIDKYGDKSWNTASVYATMASSSALLGQKAEKAGDIKAALAYFKRAASYNRSFADALMLFQKMSSKETADEVQTLYK